MGSYKGNLVAIKHVSSSSVNLRHQDHIILNTVSYVFKILLHLSRIFNFFNYIYIYISYRLLG